MKKTIIIKPTHELVEKTQRNALRSNVIGVVGEKNSTILEFVKPSDINGDSIENYTMRAVLNNKFGSHLVDITGTELVIGSDLTTDTELTLAVQFLKDDEVKWESFPLKFRLFPTLDSSGNHGDSGKDKLRAELAKKLHELTGKNYTDNTWDQLMAEVADISEITPEIQDLIDQATNYENLLNSMITALWGFYGNYYKEKVMTDGA